MRQTCLEEVYHLAKADPRVLFVGSDIGSGTLDQFRAEMPERFLMEGVSEAHLIGMMAGLAMNGWIPYFNTIATFATRRCFEQLVLDAGLHRQRLRIIGSGGGTVYAPLGPTHLATDDIAILRTIPHMTILTPCDAEEMRRLMPQTLDIDGPVYIRLGKDGDPIISRADQPCVIGKACVLHRGHDVVLVSHGVVSAVALDAAQQLEKIGIGATVLHYHTLKPFEADTLLEHAARARVILCIEEHVPSGGLHSIVAEILATADLAPCPRYRRIGLPDHFLEEYGSQESQWALAGITPARVVALAHELLTAYTATR